MNQNNIKSKVIAGTSGSFCETMVRQPLFAVQTNSIANSCSFIQGCKNVYNAGGIAKFYDGLQGFGMAYFTRALHRTGVFIMNDELKNRNIPIMAIATLATVYEVAVTGVSDTVFTLTQAQSKKEHKSTPYTAFKEHIYKYGVKKVLGAGLGGSFARNTMFNVGYLGVGNTFPNFKEQNPVITATISSVTAVSISHPFEVVRTMQVSLPSKSFLEHFSDGIKSQGAVSRFSSGFPARLASAGVGSAISYAVYNKMLSKDNKSSHKTDIQLNQ